ncbi:MAG: hypothetical protein DBX47_03205 [Clostridiales bacterium]|nr:MAG: hypothetical protein DBX47_03205 [Clostridiales bacterium]
MFIKITNIEPDKNQPRKVFDKEALDELSSSIAQHGILQPIIVRPAENGQYRIISGERRWRASRLAGLTEMPVLIKNDADEKLSLEIGLIENLQREDLNIIEQARGYKSLMTDFSLTQEEIAQRVGKSRPSIANTLRILALPDEILQMVANGELTSGHARALLPLFERNPKKDYIIEQAKKIVEKGLTVRDVENMAKKEKMQQKTAKKKDIYIDELEKQLSSSLGRKTKIKYSATKKGKSGGSITIDFYSNEDLENLYNALLKRGE